MEKCELYRIVRHSWGNLKRELPGVNSCDTDVPYLRIRLKWELKLSICSKTHTGSVTLLKTSSGD